MIACLAFRLPPKHAPSLDVFVPAERQGTSFSHGFYAMRTHLDFLSHVIYIFDIFFWYIFS